MQVLKYRFQFSVLFIFFLILTGSVHAQELNPDSLWFRNNYYKVERSISMRDGIKLFTSIYIPKDSSKKHPILMERTPYSCSPYGSNEYSSYWDGYYMTYIYEKFILVKQDVRGRWMSEGKFEDIRPFIKNKKPGDTDESTDAFDAIDWLVKNIPGNNGKVGVVGTSYPGFYAGMAAASGHPALKAVSPQAPVTDWFIGDDFHHNGAFFHMEAFNFFVAGGFGRPHLHPTKEEAQMPDFFDSKDNYQFFLRKGADKNLLKLAGDSMAFFKQFFSHPNYDEWWQARNGRVAQYNIKPAVLITGGLFDAEDCYGALNLYKAIRQQSPSTKIKLVMGPWYHGQWNSSDGIQLGNISFGSNTSVTYQQQIEIPFFNYYLIGTDDPKISGATIFFTGENNWHHFESWPTEQTKPTKLYLQSRNGLSFKSPSEEKGFDEYTSDPAHPVPYAEEVHFNRTREYMTDDQRFASRRPDVLTYQTNILSEDLTLGGEVTADLRTSITTTDADFLVKIIDVFPDTGSYYTQDIYAVNEGKKIYPMGGYEMLVRAEIMRGKYRKSFERPEPFVPGQIETVRFKTNDIAHTFRKGHRLMIQIQSSWFPLVDRNPQKFTDIYFCDDDDFQKSNIKIYHNSKNASSIILPVITGKVE